MPVLTPTKATGGRAKPVPGLYVEPGCEMTDDMLEASLVDTGLNGPFVADLLSGMLAHERCGRHLYRTCAERSHNPMLQLKYREYGEETERHVAILEELVNALRGDPSYVSPMARAVQGMDTKLVESTFLGSGSIDLMTAETAMLDAVFLAESTCHSNWKVLSKLCGSLSDGPVRDQFQRAVDEVEDQEDEHLEWAQSTRERMVTLQAESGVMASVGMEAEETIARIRSWFSDEG